MSEKIIRELALLSKPTIVPKKWGREVIIENSDLYCGKILEFNLGSQFSMHFHAKKTETWYILEGKLNLELINVDTAAIQRYQLNEGDVITLFPLIPHRLTCIEKARIIEVSTQHFDDDSYRVAPGDSQK